MGVRPKRPGRPKRPDHLKLIAGTLRTAQPKNELQPETMIPPVPDHLSDEAKAEYQRITIELAKLRLISKLDRAALAAYAECWSDYVGAARLYAAATDAEERKIYYGIKKRSLELMHKFLREFGMSPAARSGIESDPEPAPSPVGGRWDGFDNNNGA
jgi:P27 family predicted phage terminase small subunit